VDWRRANVPVRDTTPVQVMPIKTRPLPPLPELQDLFEYIDGNLVRKKTTAPNAKKDQIAGTNSNGYVLININRVFYRAHRIIWYLHTHTDPLGYDIDHIDGNPLNNRIENLRLCPHSDNCKNSKISKRNTSGFKGVHFHRQSGRWRARIRCNGKHLHIGMFDTAEEAHEAYVRESVRLQGNYSIYNK
jgi:hypothetical protein